MDLKLVLNMIMEPKKYVKFLGDRKLLYWMKDETYLKLIFYCETGKRLNLKSPVTFNEKLQWLKLYDRKPEYSTYVDKYAVRNHIKNTIGEEYLIPLIGVYNRVSDIPWSGLPDRFALKCTHGSSSNIICKDKSKLNVEASIIKLNRWMKKSWYWFGREWPYKNVKPSIVCEKYISENGEPPEDYKVMCFHGKAKLIEVHRDRFNERHAQDFYDINWKKTSISQSYAGLPNSQAVIPKPACFDQMISLSQVLAKDKYHVRVDWYIVGNKLYFGELTFFDASGFANFDNYSDDLMIGSWLKLPM